MSESAIRLDLVTPELLTQMLAPRWPGIRVTGIELLHAIPGTATKLRLRLQYADKPADAPETLWLKGGLEAHSVDYAALCASEGGFYREFAAIIAPGCPRSWYAPPREGGAPPYLLLEVLVARGVRFGYYWGYGDYEVALFGRSAEHTSEHQSLMRHPYAIFC